jgi:endonuclease YncB( thermonuclease family)
MRRAGDLRLAVLFNVKYAAHFLALQHEAREAKRGLWGER